MIWPWLLTGLIVAVAIGYWLLIITEGTYLGTRAVILMYDWTAGRYNAIKKMRYVDEAFFLGSPLVEELRRIPSPRVLDVATGTGRLPRAVETGSEFGGQVVGVDHSERMLREAQDAIAQDGLKTQLIQGDAHSLMFDDSTFDAVTCLESLEFMRDPRQAVREMVRVLEPGGVLLVSNRVGLEAWLFPGRHCQRGRLEAMLAEEGLVEIDTRRWQVYYDLIWAKKAWPC